MGRGIRRYIMSYMEQALLQKLICLQLVKKFQILWNPEVQYCVYESLLLVLKVK
jgi:hypothetical protein